MLNLGGGFGQGKLSWTGDSIDDTGFGMVLKMGVGTNDQVQIYCTNQVLWYSPGRFTNTVLNGMTGLGFSYFFEPQAPSFFISGAFGVGVFAASDFGGGETGFGFTLGAGYEIVRSFSIEFTFMNSGLSDYFEDTSISNILVTLNWLAY